MVTRAKLFPLWPAGAVSTEGPGFYTEITRSKTSGTIFLFYFEFQPQIKLG